MAFDAKHLSTAARKVCKMEHMTPREFDRFPGPVWDGEDCEEVVVLEVRNSKRTLEITNRDLVYAEQYDTGPGRPRFDPASPTVRTAIRLTNAQLAKAEAIGNGNVSAGVRQALEEYGKTEALDIRDQLAL